MLFAGAVSPLPIAETLEDPRWRPLMLGYRPGGAGPGPGGSGGLRRVRA